MPRHRAPRVGGFTLLEALVTLIIMSLLVTLLTQTLQQSLRMRERLQHYQRASRVESLQEQWFRDSVGSAVADLPDALGTLRGVASTLDMLTSAPLDAGGLQRVRWSLKAVDGGTALYYDGGLLKDVVVIRGPLVDARFRYLNDDNKWVERWMPALDSPIALPRAVRLEADMGAGRLLWLVPIISERNTPGYMRLEDLGSDM